jgi:mRNA-degrading endonuclease toxin of MazEF toxin-antitoxin module
MASVDDVWLVDFGDAYPGEPASHRPALILGPPETFGTSFPFTGRSAQVACLDSSLTRRIRGVVRTTDCRYYG